MSNYTPALYADVSAVLANGDIPPTAPEFGLCSDGVGLFYRGKLNVIVSDPETGKTMMALSVAADVLFTGGSVLVIDLDHNTAPSIIARLRAMGVSAAVLSDPSRFRYTDADNTDDLLAVIAEAQHWQPGLVVLDSLGELMPIFGASSNSADEYTGVHARVIKPLTKAGAGVLALDHLAKNVESRAFGATGTIAKKRSVDGTMLRVNMIEPFAPGKVGESELLLLKDRHGGLRARRAAGKEPVAARYRLEPRGEGALHWRFTAPTAGHVPQSESRAIADAKRMADSSYVPGSVRDVKARFNWGTDRAQAAIKVFREHSEPQELQVQEEQV